MRGKCRTEDLSDSLFLSPFLPLLMFGSMQDHLSAPQWLRWKIFYFPQYQSDSSVRNNISSANIFSVEADHSPFGCQSSTWPLRWPSSLQSSPLPSSFHTVRTIYVIMVSKFGFQHSRRRSRSLQWHLDNECGYLGNSIWTYGRRN